MPIPEDRPVAARSTIVCARAAEKPINDLEHKPGVVCGRDTTPV